MFQVFITIPRTISGHGLGAACILNNPPTSSESACWAILSEMDPPGGTGRWLGCVHAYGGYLTHSNLLAR
jgi:hypothetical protein